MEIKGFAVSMAWPVTLCKRPGGWYENLMHLTKFSKNGYYKVGHAALTLVDGSSGQCYYFDFGRYHAPHGYGRVRDVESDMDLKISTEIVFNNQVPTNIHELYEELQQLEACHGDGKLDVGIIPIDFESSFKRAKVIQAMDFVPYGPFIYGGTNCARFVREVVNAGSNSVPSKLAFRSCYALTPTPKWLVNVTRAFYPSVQNFETSGINIVNNA
jgi:hypothetical protein